MEHCIAACVVGSWHVVDAASAIDDHVSYIVCQVMSCRSTQDAGGPDMWTKASQRKCALCCKAVLGQEGQHRQRQGRASLCVLCLTYWRYDCMQAVCENIAKDAETFKLPGVGPGYNGLQTLPGWTQQLLQPAERRTLPGHAAWFHDS